MTFIPQNELKTSHAICQFFFGMRLTIIGTKSLISILDKAFLLQSLIFEILQRILFHEILIISF
jgi:hypothetical protein